MTDKEKNEVIEFLNRKTWDRVAQFQLVDLWNTYRTDLPKIGKLDVRTPCRLRQVVGSFRKFCSSEIK